MREKKHVLIVEDEHALAAALATVAERMGARVTLAPSGKRALAAIRDETPDLIVLDIGLPDMSGLDVLASAFPETQGIPLPVLVVTAHGHLENALAATRMGVAEYLVKPLDLHAFERSIRGLLDSVAPNPVAEASAAPPTETTIIGGAPSMQRVFRDIAQACSGLSPVVISGAPGAGKSLAARVIHANGSLAGMPLVAVDLAEDNALPPGWDGTLLLENIDLLPVTAQADLARRMEAGLPPGTRIIATTRTNLHETVRAGRLREDLYYRLRVLEIRMPPLAERREDIPALAAFFLGKACSDRSIGFSPEAMALMTAYPWPGNVWELRNAVDYALAVCGGSRILPQHLPVALTLSDDEGGDPITGELRRALRRWIARELQAGDEPRAYADILDDIESLLLGELLERFGNKPTRLAEALKIHRTTLRRKCARLEK
jgi:DNA-binding NtrC family response regulator